MEERIFNYDIMQQIRERWSPRAFSEEKVSREDILAILEAARYAPSCFNEQPWRFLIADEGERLAKLRGVLSQSNREWAARAPVLILIASVKAFEYNGAPNPWHVFDAGTAWGFLSLEAQRRGLITHAMAGFKKEEARKVFGISEELDIITVVAVGRYGDKGSLSSELQSREYPQTRETLESLLL